MPVGSEGLIVLDYFQGNRTPHTDLLARGLVMGLSLQSSRAHVFRAIMEGIAYGTKEILDNFKLNRCDVSRVIACGGATHSPLFMQIYADVIGQPIYTTRVTEASLLGSAVAAAYGAGLYSSLSEASRSMVQLSGSYEPHMSSTTKNTNSMLNSTVRPIEYYTQCSIILRGMFKSEFHPFITARDCAKTGHHDEGIQSHLCR